MTNKEIIEKLKSELIKKDELLKLCEESYNALLTEYNKLNKLYNRIADELAGLKYSI